MEMEYLTSENELDYETPIVGEGILPFKLPGYYPNGEFKEFDLADNYKNGKWTILFFYPADFTFVCPTEIKAFSDSVEKFKELGAEIVSISVDSTYVHSAWQENSLGKINFPMLSDQQHFVSKYLGVFAYDKGVSWRGTFIISPKGKLYINYSTFGEVGRSTEEVLRLLEASKMAYEGKMIPCNWYPGTETL